MDQDALLAKLIGSDLAKLTTAERVELYRTTCASLGLNPYSRPFEYIWLGGRLVLYAKKDATDQLRKRDRISTRIINQTVNDDVYVVTVQAMTPDGRIDEETGASSLAGLHGEARANAIMKAVTKAKRRATLAICGLGWLDETEVETIPDARPVDQGADDVDASPAAQGRHATPAQLRKIFAVARAHGWTVDELKAHVIGTYDVVSSKDLSEDEANELIAYIESGNRPAIAPLRTNGEDRE